MNSKNDDNVLVLHGTTLTEDESLWGDWRVERNDDTESGIPTLTIMRTVNGEVMDSIALEAFGNMILVHRPDDRPQQLEQLFASLRPILRVRRAAVERGIDVDDIPPMLVHTRVAERVWGAGMTVPFPSEGVMDIGGIRVVWHRALDSDVVAS